MLSEAKRLLDEGRVSEKELERLLISHLEVALLPLPITHPHRRAWHLQISPGRSACGTVAKAHAQ